MVRRLLLATALAIVLVAAATPAAWADGPPAYWQQKGCEHGHRSKKAYTVIRGLVRTTNPTIREGRVHHWSTCLATRAKAHHAHYLARVYRHWRLDEPQRFRILLLRNYSWTIGWLARTRSCESGGDYTAVSDSGKYRGGYQFDYRTWASVGGTGDPAAAHPWEQDFRAAVLYAIAGPGRWPVCG